MGYLIDPIRGAAACAVSWAALIDGEFGLARRTDLHEDFSRHDVVRGGSDRAFGLIVGGLSLLIGGWQWISSGTVALGSGLLLVVGIALVALALTAPRLLGPLNRLWIKLGLTLNRLVSPLVLGLLFYTTVTPIGLIIRLAGKDPLRLALDRSAESYWIERRPPGPAPDSMIHQF